MKKKSKYVSFLNLEAWFPFELMVDYCIVDMVVGWLNIIVLLIWLYWLNNIWFLLKKLFKYKWHIRCSMKCLLDFVFVIFYILILGWWYLDAKFFWCKVHYVAPICYDKGACCIVPKWQMHVAPKFWCDRCLHTYLVL